MSASGLRRVSWPIAALAVLALLAPGAAMASPVRLLAPSAGAALVAGSAAEIAWEPSAELARLPRAEEWEAFLSLDGGATYPLRLTPHLDRDVRRIGFVVPSVATADARLLLRLGDERHEMLVPVEARFSIVAPAVALPLAADAALFAARATVVHGEPALGRGEGVVAWVEGSRRGARLRQVVGRAWSGLAPVAAPAAASTVVALLGDETFPQHLLAPAGGVRTPPPPRARLPAPAAAPRPAPDILRLTQRQNE